MKDPNSPPDLNARRRQAEDRLADEPDPPAELAPAKAIRLIRQLQMHQLELEMQNDELRLSQARIEEFRRAYDDLYDNTPMGCLTLDPEGCIVEANLTAAALLGMERGRLLQLNLPFANFLVKADRPVFRQLLASGPSARGRRREFRRQDKNGELRIMQLNLLRLQDAQGRERQCLSLTDITALQRVQEELRLHHDDLAALVAERTAQLSEANGRLKDADTQLEALFLAAPWAIGVFDGQGRVVKTNPAGAHLFGRPQEEVTGGSPLSNPAGVPEDFLALWRRALDGETLAGVELKQPRHDGSNLDISLSAAPLHDQEGRFRGFVAVAEDITRRKGHERALRQSETRYRRIVETAQEGIWTLDKDLYTTYVNRQMADMLGYSPEDLIGKPVTNFLFPEDLADHWERVNTRSREKYERRIRRRDGSELWTQVAVRALKNDAREFVGSFAMLTDITKRKRAEEDLKRSEQCVRARLDSILSPDGDIGSLELEGCIDVPAIQSLMEDFYQLTHVSMALIDLKGKVLVGVGWQDICTKFHRVHPESRRLCVESDTVLSGNIPPGTFKIYKCQNHLWDLATPIMMGDQHVGNLFMGQLFFEDEYTDYEFFRAQAQEFGFDEEAYLAAVAAVPRVNRQALGRAITFFTRLAHLISLLSLSNVKLARSVSEQERLVASLQRGEERLRASLQEKDVMLKEIHHRVKNNMQVISTLLDLQLKYQQDQDPASLFRDCQNRIRSMALIHESLYHTDTLASINFRQYLEKLVKRLLVSFGSTAQGVRATVTGADLYLGINQAVPAGLVASEIIVNCLKHAFAGRESGEIHISLEKGDGQEVVAIRDNGIGLDREVELENPTTFGWLMITNLMKQMGGVIVVTSDGGTTCRMVF